MTHSSIRPGLPAIFLTARFTDAVGYASALHATQIRKGTQVPYVAHLLGVASLVLEAEGDEDMAIGGLLHDAAEDQGGEARLHDIEARFGTTVAGYVRSCSDYLGDDPARKPPWRERKQAYLEHLARTDRRTQIVSIADKVHNARAIHTDVLVIGAAVFRKFKVDAELTLWYYDSCLAIARGNDLPKALVEPLAAAINGIRQGLLQPGDAK